MEAWREAAALVAVFGLLGAAVWMLRHRTGAVRKGASKSVEAIERIALTPQHTLHLVRASGRELLVATHPHGCSLLLEKISESSQPAAPARVSEPSLSEQLFPGKTFSEKRQEKA